MPLVVCAKCGFANQLPDSVSRRDSCEKCLNDLHSCVHCKFYERGSYNDCRENRAERVLEKDRANYCDYFEAKSAALSGSAKTDEKPQPTARELAEALFKKKD